MDLSAFPYLQGNYAPVFEESDCGPGELRVEGEIPTALTGSFMRNGANVAFQPNHLPIRDCISSGERPKSP